VVWRRWRRRRVYIQLCRVVVLDILHTSMRAFTHGVWVPPKTNPTYTRFVQESETHREFETADYLALHLPWNHEIFTENVFMYDSYCPKFSERDSKIYVLETRLCAFHYIKNNGMFSQIPPDGLDLSF